MDKLLGMGSVPAHLKSQANDKEIRRMIAIINSMTLEERRNPDLIKASRKRRIAGCGLQVQDVNRLMKQHLQMSTVMKQFSKGGLCKLMAGMKGKLPPGALAGMHHIFTPIAADRVVMESTLIFTQLLQDVIIKKEKPHRNHSSFLEPSGRKRKYAIVCCLQSID